ncbi:glycosyltransferase family 2 protein [Dokdonia donghaensis]|uniref:Glycosyl transferase family 2 n=1 Tax=Dokdonia donghaensis DSW-1 TaxID=1300343 RepID=A0A0A2GSN8_9FLAO|nr:glycosyltransferase family 2 protein [Dokdonia donghaensis]ANH61620.1 N-acetylglucosaminyl-diphospho-decaprenol L-rhamnosyltransferase [Dokdonia donghaensis DSW-1]KGO06217.1 glycosyl transferase family 2 [Dokdonia donghaensis DSW-1]
MQLSIVIVNYNVKDYLHLCLDSVTASIQNLDAEIIVVDNASIDGSAAMVKELFPQVILIANKDNVGFSKANNQGVAVAQGEYVCILNPDTVVGENTFNDVYAFAKAQQKPGIIGVQLVDGTGEFLPESKRNVPTLKVSLNKMIGDARHYYASHLKNDQTGKVAVLVGAFMFMPRAVYTEVGGFDERYFMYGEDIDLSYTVSQAGYTNYYLGSTEIIHFKGESTVKDKRYRKRFYGAMQLFYDKHLYKNIFQQTLVRLGLGVAKAKSWITHFKNQAVIKDHQKIKEYILLSNNDDLARKLSQSVKKTVVTQNKLSATKTGQEILFDAQYTGYDKIIKEIITHSSSGVSYKLIPKKSTFAIGSNSSEGRGEIITFET